MPEPPSSLAKVSFTNRYGRSFEIEMVLDDQRSYNATYPGGDRGMEPMYAVRYADPTGVINPLVVAFAQRTVGVKELIESIAGAAARYALKESRGGGDEELPPVSGIARPLHVSAGLAILAGSTDYRLRGPAGSVRVIRADQYGTVDVWVEPRGVVDEDEEDEEDRD